MRQIDSAKAVRSFGKLVDTLHAGPWTITRYGRPIAILAYWDESYTQMDPPLAVSPTARPVSEPLVVSNAGGLEPQQRARQSRPDLGGRERAGRSEPVGSTDDADALVSVVESPTLPLADYTIHPVNEAGEQIGPDVPVTTVAAHPNLTMHRKGAVGTPGPEPAQATSSSAGSTPVASISVRLNPQAEAQARRDAILSKVRR